MENSEGRFNRREFLHKGTVMTVGSAALTNTALSYTRILGANDRISLGHIGVGNRGSELDGIVARLHRDPVAAELRGRERARSKRASESRRVDRRTATVFLHPFLFGHMLA